MLDPSLQFIPTDIVRKKIAFFERAHNSHLIDIFHHCDSCCYEVDLRRVEILQKQEPCVFRFGEILFFFRLQFRQLDYSSGFEIIVCHYIWALKHTEVEIQTATVKYTSTVVRTYCSIRVRWMTYRSPLNDNENRLLLPLLAIFDTSHE